MTAVGSAMPRMMQTMLVINRMRKMLLPASASRMDDMLKLRPAS